MPYSSWEGVGHRSQPHPIPEARRVFEVWEPLITPSWSVREYLLSIFTSNVVACLPWHKAWGGLVPSAMAWVRPALCSDYPRMTVLQDLHGSVLVGVCKH